MSRKNQKWSIIFLFLTLVSGFIFSPSAISASFVSLSNESGGGGGVPFVDMVAPNSRISAITIRSGNIIDSIKLSYRYRNSVSEKSYGGNGGKSKTFKFGKGEYITEFGGRSGKYVDSIYIKTNKRRTMRWGGKGGANSFRFRATKNQQITGIWGRAGKYLDAIGIIKKSPYGNTENISAQGNLDNFKPIGQGSNDQNCAKCDSAPTAYFPVPSKKKSDKDFWENQSDRLGNAIEALTHSKQVYRNYLEKERKSCGPNLYCQIDTRSRAITFVTGAK